VRLSDPEGRVLAVAESDGVGTLRLLRVLAAGGQETGQGAGPAHGRSRGDDD
jgi:hypothetical protein